MATIEDVARSAGVSVSTAHYALTGKRPISPATRARVERAVEELGYRAHAGARALASQRTQVIGLVAPLRVGVDVAVIMQFVTGVVTRAQEEAHDVLLLTRDDQDGVQRVTAGSMVDALVVMDVEADDERIPVLRACRQPAVLIGLPADCDGLDCVDLDFEQAARIAAEHLVDVGRRSIALIGSPQAVMDRGTTYAQRTVRGFTTAAAGRGVAAVFVPCEPSTGGAHAAIATAFELLPDLDGLVVHNEMALPGVLEALRERSINVPEEMSIVALCPTDVATGQTIQLTAVELPASQIGAEAVRIAMSRLADPTHPATTELVPAHLTVRASSVPSDTAAPRA